jgi:hypothetical protein
MTAPKLAAVLAVDVVGHLRLMGGDEADTGVTPLSQPHEACFRAITCTTRVLMTENSASPGATACRPAPEPWRGLNGISALSKSRYGCSLSRQKAII